jgi:hypothetical protein
MKRTLHNLQTGEITVVDMTSDEVAAKQAKQVEYDKVKYKKDRVFSYPSIGEQLDLLYKDLLAGKVDATGEWAKAVKKVKDDNPKP